MTTGDVEVPAASRHAGAARPRPRYELRLLRASHPDMPVVAVRSRHRFRLFAEWSRRLDAEHLRLLPGCALTVVDVRRERAHTAARVPARDSSGSLAA